MRKLAVLLVVAAACTPLPSFDEDETAGDRLRDQLADRIPSSAGATSTSEALNADLAALMLGSPTDAQKSAAVALAAQLSDAERATLAAIDWEVASASSLLAMPAFVKALAAVEPSLAGSIKTSPAGDGYRCKADECTTVRAGLERAVAALSAALTNRAAYAAGSPLGAFVAKGSTCRENASSGAPTDTVCAGFVGYVLGEQIAALAGTVCTATSEGTVIVQALGDPMSASELDALCVP